MFVSNPIARDPRVLREAEYLTHAGHDVTVIGRLDDALPAREAWRGVTFRRFPPPITAKVDLASPFWPFRKWWRRLRKGAGWVRAGLSARADIYHAHDLNTLPHAFLCAKLTRKKLVYDSHELWTLWRQEIPRLLRWWERVGARRADLVVTVGDAVAGELERLHDIPRPLVVRNCAPLMPLERTDKLRRTIGGDQSRPILVYEGGFRSGRALTEIVAAADEVPGVDFVMFGPEEPHKEQVRQAASKAKHGNVHILPAVPVDDVVDLLVSADVGLSLIQPICRSYELSEPIKTYDYMIAGLAILASPIPSHQRLSEETGAFVLADPYDPKDIARVARKIIADRERLRQMGLRARQWAERKYNAAREMEKLVRAYEQLAEPKTK